MKDKQYLLMILDGVGLNDELAGNAFKQAEKPNFNRLINIYPNTSVQSSGLAVGLPEGQMGNSEVGHTNMGAGRIIYQELTRIAKEIQDGGFYKNRALLDAIENAKNSTHKLHVMGLVSDGGVHSHQEHLYAILRMAKEHGLEEVYIHAFLDGRDTPPSSAADLLKALEEKIHEIGIGKIVTLEGRYYAMDRDQRWDRVKLAYDALTMGIGNKSRSVQKAIENSYESQVFDEFVKPTIIVDEDSQPIATIKNGDSIIFFNFRPDRAREITRALVDDDFTGFEREVKLKDLTFVTMTSYDSTIPNVRVAFTQQSIKNTFGEYISNLGYSQLRIAETEKYPHVTFFFNGGQENEYDNESRILIPSPKVATYDLKPEMSAIEVTDEVVKAIENREYDCIIMNYANGDMVGHTGNMEKTLEAIGVLDVCIGRVISALEKVGGEAIITSDHGNCEAMVDAKTGEQITAHSTFDVPLIVVSNRVKAVTDGKLCDIAPTLLDLMGLEKPQEMTGQSMIEIDGD